MNLDADRPAATAAARGTRAVHSIDHYALLVPDLDIAANFLDAFGLRVVRGENCLEVYAQGDHCWARIFAGERKRLAYLSFNCFAEDLEGIRQQLLASGARPADASPFIDGAGTWFLDPDGNLLQVKAGPKTTPDSKRDATLGSTPAGVRGASVRSKVARVRPRRLSHVLLFTPDVQRALTFYEGALGLRLSDRSGDIIAFIHAPHGSDHHLIAFVKSSAKGWHHASWDVRDVNEVGNGASQMAKAGYPHGWGTGRHVLGSNYFFYVLDPWGSFCEYSADIDFIAAGSNWPAGDFDPEDSLYQWGPDLPDYFIRNTEA